MGDGALLAGVITTLVLVIGNIVLGAFHYGRLTQKVEELCRRVKMIEEKKAKRG